MSVFLVKVQRHFDAAHFLPKHKRECGRLHGHRWLVRAAWEGEEDRETGMVVDFADLKGVLDTVLKRYDHHCLNDFLPNPTAEQIAKKLFHSLEQVYTGNERLMYVEVEESPGCVVLYEREKGVSDQ